VSQHPWFALQVRTRHEAGVANYLLGQGYESFLPLYKCRKRWSDRIKEVQTPLFPGYLFCRFDAQDRLPIMKTPGVMQIVGVNRVPVAVDESEISAIQTLAGTGLPNQPWPFLQVGERVRIESGSLWISRAVIGWCFPSRCSSVRYRWKSIVRSSPRRHCHGNHEWKKCW
jgi:transcription antitermination factor NusG